MTPKIPTPRPAHSLWVENFGCDKSSLLGDERGIARFRKVVATGVSRSHNVTWPDCCCVFFFSSTANSYFQVAFSGR